MLKPTSVLLFLIALGSGVFAQHKNQTSNKVKASLYQSGLQNLKQIDGEAGERVIHELSDFSPDLCSLIVEHVFGEIYARDILDLKSKEIVVIAALIAMGTAEPQLKVHLHGALNTGSTVNEVMEVILQMIIYAGFPNAINAMHLFQQVVTERKEKGFLDKLGVTAPLSEKNKFVLGKQELAKLDSAQLNALNSAFADFSPELVQLIVEFAYGSVISRDNLDIKTRQIATIAALAAKGNTRSQLKFHINAGLNVGLSELEIKEIMILLSVYAGFPATINGMNVLKEVLAERL